MGNKKEVELLRVIVGIRRESLLDLPSFPVSSTSFLRCSHQGLELARLHLPSWHSFVLF